MEYRIVTQIDRGSLEALTKAINRITLRRRFIIERVFIIVIAFMAFSNVIFTAMSHSGHPWVFALLGIFILVYHFYLQDKLLSGSAYKQVTDDAKKPYLTVFTEENYRIVLEHAQSDYAYDGIQDICETDTYLIFLMGKRLGQVYTKSAFADYNYEEFKQFITEKTGKTIIRL